MTVSMDGVVNTVQIPSSATPPSYTAMETNSESEGDGRVVVSFATKMDIASEGEGWVVHVCMHILMVHVHVS